MHRPNVTSNIDMKEIQFLQELGVGMSGSVCKFIQIRNISCTIIIKCFLYEITHIL